MRTAAHSADTTPRVHAHHAPHTIPRKAADNASVRKRAAAPHADARITCAVGPTQRASRTTHTRPGTQAVPPANSKRPRKPATSGPPIAVPRSSLKCLSELSLECQQQLALVVLRTRRTTRDDERIESYAEFHTERFRQLMSDVAFSRDVKTIWAAAEGVQAPDVPKMHAYAARLTNFRKRVLAYPIHAAQTSQHHV